LTDPQVPDVPYGGTTPELGRPAPGWLRHLFDEPAEPEAGSVVLLAEPPRSVPLAHRVSALGLGPWEAFAVVLIVVAPLALWITSPQLRTVALVVGVPVLVATRLRRYARRVGVLRWGKVATVSTTTSRVSGTNFTNVPMRQASGWNVSTRLYTGGGTTTQLTYLVDGQTGSLTLRGLPYVDGVVLADPRHPGRAMVVSQFPHAVRPGLDGQLVGRLAPGRWAWLLSTLALQAGLVALAVWSVLDTWVH
jgi:hypothetical protein